MSTPKQGLVARQLSEKLGLKGLVLATAESCTGGMLAAAITDIPGSSRWFDRGFITYSNAAKISHLGVSADTLQSFGAVSEETAMEMASGALVATPEADVAIATTGIAGPDGGTAGKPVGMVCFGFAHRTSSGISMRAKTHHFSGDRHQVRQAAVEEALSWLIQLA